MKLLYVFPEPLPLPGKARAIQVIKTVAALGAAGVKVTLAYVQDRPVSGHPFSAYGMDLPPNVSLLPLSRRIPVLGLKTGWMFVRRLQQWLRQQRVGGEAPTFVFVRHVKFADRWLRTDLKLPLVYEAHEVFADTAPEKKQAAMAEMELRVLQAAAAVIAITGQLASLLKARYGLQREISVVPSATDLPAAPIEKDWSGIRRSIVYAGSLYGWKGVDDLVDAARFLPKGVQITVIGGDAEGIARLQARQAGEGAEIRYLGQLPHPEVMAHLAKACVAVLPNRAGSVSAFTSPLKLFEYMASGCALVVSDLPVFKEILDASDAAWFEPGNPRSLSDAIKYLLNNPAEAEESGTKLAIEVHQYSWKARAVTLIEICFGKQEKDALDV